MSVENFIDTNIFIYRLENIDKHKTNIAEELIRRGLETNDACISFQVVQECLNTISRKAKKKMDLIKTKMYLNTVLLPLWKVSPKPDLYQNCLDIQQRYQYSFYDSLIIAAALEVGCKRIYSEDLQHGQKIERLTIVNPFLKS